MDFSSVRNFFYPERKDQTLVLSRSWGKYSYWSLSENRAGVLKVVACTSELFLNSFVYLANWCVWTWDWALSEKNSLNASLHPVEKPRERETCLTLEDMQSQTNQISFDEVAMRFSIVKGLLDVYENLLNSNSNNSKLAAFIRFELLAIKSEVTYLKQSQSYLEALLQEKNNNISSDSLIEQDVKSDSATQIQGLLKEIKEIDRVFIQLSANVDRNETRDHEIQSNSVVGFTNVGNTCYINSALQPLLAIPNFLSLLPNEEKMQSLAEPQREIIKSLKNFLDAWENKETSSQKLGGLIGKLRTTIFKQGLSEGGFVNQAAEKAMQDAGSFFELILHVIGLEYSVKNTRSFTDIFEITEDRTDIHKIEKNEPRQVFFLKSEKESVQERVDEYTAGFSDELTEDNALVISQEGSHESLSLRQCKESETITSDPQKLFVFRVENYSVNLNTDLEIDLTKLFENQNFSSPLTYELVGFAQNHSQVHWTSVVKSGPNWHFCNDALVKKIVQTSSEVQIPANYLVYSRKT